MKKVIILAVLYTIAFIGCVIAWDHHIGNKYLNGVVLVVCFAITQVIGFYATSDKKK